MRNQKRKLGYLLVATSLLGNLHAQADLCYCTVMVQFDLSQMRWIVHPCGGNCIPGEGACANASTFLADGTEVRGCACLQSDGSLKSPQCYCSGVVVNPLFDEDQEPSRVDCTSLQACPVSVHKCSAAHLLAFPLYPVGACRCQG